MEYGLFSFLDDHERARELEEEVQKILSEFPLTVLTSSYYNEDVDKNVLVFVTYQFGDKYVFESAFNKDEEAERIVLDQIESMSRSMYEAAIPDGAPNDIEDERDEPYFISNTCSDIECGGTLVIPDEFSKLDVYNTWECNECQMTHIDSSEKWDEWV